MPVNPLTTEVARGLTRDGRAHLGYVNLLVFQALALFLWWPKSSLPEMLARADRPDTLLAVAIVCVITIGYHQVRCGAEEFLLPGQHGLREWAVATDLPLSRILAGHLVGVALQLIHALALSSPLWMVAFAVCDATLAGVLTVFGATALLALELRLGAALIGLLIGHHPAACFFAVRGWLATALLAPVLLPAVSYLGVAARLLDGASDPSVRGAVAGVFLACHTMFCVLALVTMHHVLKRVRVRSAGGEPA